jgi:hypothetical protein
MTDIDNADHVAKNQQGFSDRRRVILEYVRRQTDFLSGRASRTGITTWVVLAGLFAAIWSVQESLVTVLTSSRLLKASLLGFALSSTATFFTYVVLWPAFGSPAKSLPDQNSGPATGRVIRSLLSYYLHLVSS